MYQACYYESLVHIQAHVCMHACARANAYICIMLIHPSALQVLEFAETKHFAKPAPRPLARENASKSR